MLSPARCGAPAPSMGTGWGALTPSPLGKGWGALTPSPLGKGWGALTPSPFMGEGWGGGAGLALS